MIDLEELSVSDAAWNGSTARFDDAQWKKACAACEGKSDAPKTDCYLPHHEPGGAVSRAGVHNAAARFNQTQRANKDKAKSHLAAHYRNDLKEEVPAVLGGEAKSAEGFDAEEAGRRFAEGFAERAKPCEGCDDEALGLVNPRAIRADLRGTRETRTAARSEFELREIPDGTGGTNLRFTGYAAVTGVPYEMEDYLGPWTESIERGAFKRVIDEKHDVAFLLNHEGMTLARTKAGTLNLSEDSTGLHSEALLDPRNPTVQAMRSAVDRGDLDEMSFAFRANRQEWNDDYTRRWINDVTMNQGDVSLVNYAANPHTGGLVAMRRRQVELTTRAVISALKELRVGKQFSGDSMAVLTQVLNLTADADKSVDQVQLILSELLGVPNPNDDDPTDHPIGDQEESAPAIDSRALLLWKTKFDVLKTR